MNTSKRSAVRSLASLLVCLGLTLGAARARAGEPAAPPPAKASVPAADAKEVTLKGTLGCGKCSFHEADACENVLKVKDGGKETTYLLADNEVSRANHEKVCGPASPATVTGVVSDAKPKSKSKTKSKQAGRKLLTASAITFGAP